ncbi:MAG TPA: hypothetical protein VGR89_08635, partial [Puia sp.]|nr:hypothetical protein [Puia sp.]
MKKNYLAVALLTVTIAVRAESIFQFPLSGCQVMKGAGLLQVPVQRTNDIDTVASVTVATLAISASP